MFLQVRWRQSLYVLAIAVVSIWILQYNFTGKIIPGRYGSGSGSSSDEKPSVYLRQGKIVGIEVKTGYPQVLEEFLGVPYALSTAGEGRFRSAVPVHENRDEEFDASKYGHRCPAGAPDAVVQGEDCLNLNIYRPKTVNSKVKRKVPVLIYFHGGSFNFGKGSNRQISNLVAWATEPFIGISFNYRVGALGFLSGEVAKEGALNLGLRDQEVLLQWVQDNIEAFGGDKDRVTLMGLSAGAHSVGHHLFHKVDQKPPFARVILESGAPTARACYPYNHFLHTEQFNEFTKILGAFEIPEEQLLGYLRQKDVDLIRRASDTVYKKYDPSVRWPWQPVIDGPEGMITRPPVEKWKQGEFHRVPILTGYNTDEGAMFVPSTASKSSDFTEFFKTLLPQLSAEDREELETLYSDPSIDEESPYLSPPRKGFGAQHARLSAAYGQFAYIAPVLQTAHHATLLNDSAPLFLYHFAAISSVRGSDHSSQSAWVTYNSDIRSKSSTVNTISGSMHAFWTSFILTGDPNAVPGRWPERRRWDAFVRGERQGRLLVFGKGNDEVAGGFIPGEVAVVEDDGFARREAEWWWERVGLFEV